MSFKLPANYNTIVKAAKADIARIKANPELGKAKPKEDTAPTTETPTTGDNPFDPTMLGSVLSAGLFNNNAFPEQASSFNPWNNLQELQQWAATLDPYDPQTEALQYQLNDLQSTMGPSPSLLIQNFFDMFVDVLAELLSKKPA